MTINFPFIHRSYLPWVILWDKLDPVSVSLLMARMVLTIKLLCKLFAFSRRLEKAIKFSFSDLLKENLYSETVKYYYPSHFFSNSLIYCNLIEKHHKCHYQETTIYGSIFLQRIILSKIMSGLIRKRKCISKTTLVFSLK